MKIQEKINKMNLNVHTKHFEKNIDIIDLNSAIDSFQDAKMHLDEEINASLA